MSSVNPAVQRCANAYQQTYSIEKGKGANSVEAHVAASASYLNLMPDLTGHDSICDFIACTTYAMLHHILRESHSSKILYAAQVALGALRSKPKESSPSTPA